MTTWSRRTALIVLVFVNVILMLTACMVVWFSRNRIAFLYDPMIAAAVALTVAQIWVLAMLFAFLEPRRLRRWAWVLLFGALLSVVVIFVEFCLRLPRYDLSHWRWTQSVIYELLGRLVVLVLATWAVFAFFLFVRVSCWPFSYFFGFRLKFSGIAAAEYSPRSLRGLFFWTTAIAALIWLAMRSTSPVTMFLSNVPSVLAGIVFGPLIAGLPLVVATTFVVLRPTVVSIVGLALISVAIILVEVTVASNLPVSLPTFRIGVVVYNAILVAVSFGNIYVMKSLGLDAERN